MSFTVASHAVHTLIASQNGRGAGSPAAAPPAGQGGAVSVST